MVTVDEAKNYLRIDNDEDNDLVEAMLNTAIRLCTDVSRLSEEEFLSSSLSRVAVLFTLGYLYEHREEADHHELTLTLRSLLFALREGVF